MDYKKELQEALDALDKADKRVDKALDNLKSARRWGIWDTFGGGKFLSSAIKFGKIEKAEDQMKELEDDLKDLKKELDDVDIKLGKVKNSSSPGKVFDLFFDNIIFDISTQSKIKSNIRNLEDLQDNLEGIRKKLERELKNAWKPGLALVFNIITMSRFRNSKRKRVW